MQEWSPGAGEEGQCLMGQLPLGTMRRSEMDGGKGWTKGVNLMPQNCALKMVKMVNYTLVIFDHNFFFPGVQQEPKSPQDHPKQPPTATLRHQRPPLGPRQAGPGTLLGDAGHLSPCLPAGASKRAPRPAAGTPTAGRPARARGCDTAFDFYCKSYHDPGSQGNRTNRQVGR